MGHILAHYKGRYDVAVGFSPTGWGASASAERSKASTVNLPCDAMRHRGCPALLLQWESKPWLAGINHGWQGPMRCPGRRIGSAPHSAAAAAVESARRLCGRSGPVRARLLFRVCFGLV